MSIRDKERYYWLKLPKDFFKRHDIKIIEGLPNGKDYVLFYLKLMMESIDHEGALRFSEWIPYSAEMLASVTNTNVDTVRIAVKILEQYGMLEIWEDETIFMRHVAELLGSETYAAKRKRIQRRDEIPGDNVPQLSPACPQEIEIDTEIDTEIDITTSDEVVCRTKDVRRIVESWNGLGLQQVSKIISTSTRGKMLKARIREHGLDAIFAAIEKVGESDFLRGQNSKGWTITFEWFVRPNNFVKVLEGNYANGMIKAGKSRQYITAAEYNQRPQSDKTTDEIWASIDAI